MPILNKNGGGYDKIYGQIPVGEGGHGQKTAPEALKALGAYGTVQIGQPLSPIPLNGAGMIDAQYWGDLKLVEVGLCGLTQVEAGGTSILYITTHDSYIDYELSVDKGQAWRVGRLVYFKAPDNAGDCTLLLNGRQFVITVLGTTYKKPVITSPAPDTETPVTVMTFQSSSPEAEGVVGLWTHDTSDWEIYLDAEMTQLFKTAYHTLNKTEWTASNLNLDQDYFVRVRYQCTDSKRRYTEWSDLVRFRTSVHRAILKPTVMSPYNNQMNVPGPLTITASAFTAVGYEDTHVNTDWVISTTPNFSIIVAMSQDDTINLTSWRPPALSSLTIYYVKLRYRGAQSLSDWSDSSSFILA